MALCKKVIQLSAITVLIGALLCCGRYYAKSTQDIDPVPFKSATELTSEIQRGEITSIDLLNLYLERIERYKDDINTVWGITAVGGACRETEKTASDMG